MTVRDEVNSQGSQKALRRALQANCSMGVAGKGIDGREEWA